MIQFKSNEAKTLYFDAIIEGIDSSLVSFMFRLNVEGVEYGFPCIIEEDKIKVIIPPLEKILREDISGIFNGRLDGIGDGKYFLQTWSDTVEIKIEPKVVAKPEPVAESVSPTSLKVKAYLTSDAPKILDEKKETKKPSATNKALRDKLS